MPESPIKAPEFLTTPGLNLRKPRPEDASQIFATYTQDPEVVHYLTFLPPRDLRDTSAASRAIPGSVALRQIVLLADFSSP
jgi:hypothetical protein